MISVGVQLEAFVHASQEAAVLPSHTRAPRLGRAPLRSCGWLPQCGRSGCYLSAAGREACHTVYGGQALATGLDRLSDALRQAAAPSAPAAPAALPIGRCLTVTYGELSAAKVPGTCRALRNDLPNTQCQQQ